MCVHIRKYHLSMYGAQWLFSRLNNSERWDLWSLQNLGEWWRENYQQYAGYENVKKNKLFLKQNRKYARW